MGQTRYRVPVLEEWEVPGAVAAVPVPVPVMTMGRVDILPKKSNSNKIFRAGLDFFAISIQYGTTDIAADIIFRPGNRPALALV